MKKRSSIPYCFELTGDPYVLSKEDLIAQTDPAIQKCRKWFYPHIRLIYFSGNTVRLQLEDPPTIQIMTVTVEARRLSFSCTCHQPVETVCHHVFKSLVKLMNGNRIDYFEQFRPLGPAEMAARYPHLIRKVKPSLALEEQFMPDEKLGKVYGLSPGAKDLGTSIGRYPVKPTPAVREYETCFVLLTAHCHRRLPAIIPCTGHLNKNGDDFKQFLPFLSTIETKRLPLSADQHQLASMGLKLWQESEHLPGLFHEVPEGQSGKAQQFFQIWEDALPLLYHQPFVYLYRLHKAKELRNRPVKSNMIRCRVSKDRPELQFVLQNEGDYYRLKPELFVRGRRLDAVDLSHSLLICSGKDVYLPASARDLVLLELLDQLTIFREHYPAFEEEILTPLGQQYRVKSGIRAG